MNEQQNNNVFANGGQPNVVSNNTNVESNNTGGMFIKKPVSQEETSAQPKESLNNNFSFDIPSSSNVPNNVSLEKTEVLNTAEASNVVNDTLIMDNNSFTINVDDNVNNNNIQPDDNPFNFSVNPNITYDTQNNNNTEKKVEDNTNIVSVKKYLGHMLLFMIPLVGFIMLIVKACNKKDKNISNYAKAQLLLAAIMTVLSIIISVLVTVFVINTAGNAINNTNYNTNYIYDFDY